MNESPRPVEAGLGSTAAVGMVVFAVALALRLFRLDAESIWLDEAYSFEFASPGSSIKQVVWATGADFHPPLYYVILHLALQFDTGVFALRLPSAAFGALAAAATAVMGCIAGGRAVGLLAGLLFACSPFQVSYGQEARMYALLAFASTAALSAYLWLARDPQRLLATPASLIRRRDRAPVLIAWLILSLATAAAMLTHNLGALLPAVLTIAVGACWLRHGQGRPAALLPFVLGGLLALAVWAPWLPLLTRQLARVSGGYWISQPSLAQLVADALKVSFGRPEIVVSQAAGLAALALIVRAAWVSRALRPTLAVLLLFAGGPFVLAFAISQWRPIYLDRIVLWTAAPLFVAIALSVSTLRSAALRAAFSGLLLAAAGWNLASHYATPHKPGWAALVTYLRANVLAGDAILIHRASAALPLRYHAGLAERDGKAGLPRITEIGSPEEDVAAAIPTGTRRVWLIYSFEHMADREERIRAKLAGLGRESDRRDFGGTPGRGRPTLFLFDLGAGADPG